MTRHETLSYLLRPKVVVIDGEKISISLAAADTLLKNLIKGTAERNKRNVVLALAWNEENRYLQGLLIDLLTSNTSCPQTRKAAKDG